MNRRRLVITLPGPDYRRLADLAAHEERLVEQQASLVLRRALGQRETAREVADVRTS